MLLNQLFTCFTSEHAMACEHTIKHCPKSVNVSVGINSLTENLLWCWSACLVHPIYTCFGTCCSESNACIEHAYDSEIRDKQIAILPGENAFCRKVAM